MNDYHFHSLKFVIAILFLISNIGALQLHSRCQNSDDCNKYIKSSQCYYNRCTCQAHHIAYNDTTCLPASLLGFKCEVDAQCAVKVKNSYCNEQGICSCEPGHVKYRLGLCLKGATYNGICVGDEHCQKTSRYSYCKFFLPKIYGKCRCYNGYLPKNRKCLPVLGSLCQKDEECQELSPNSFCKKGSRTSHCTCRHGFRISHDKLDCISEPKKTPYRLTEVTEIEAKSIGKPCIHDLQCRMSDPYSVCEDWVCQCERKTSQCSLENTGCYRDTFQCNNGQCISWFFLCDGYKHCKDGSDETSCIKNRCPVMTYECKSGECINKGKLCNGRKDCKDGSDEIHCSRNSTLQNKCNPKSFQCANGQCVPAYAFCNAIYDCDDKSDEDILMCSYGRPCPTNSFRCKNKRCRSTGILCTGSDGCGDNSDETKCKVCSCPRPYF